MRILFWNNAYLPHIGGVEIYTARLAAGLIARGHEVEVIAQRLPGDPDEEVRDGVRVRRFDFLAALQGDPAQRFVAMKTLTDAIAAVKRAFQPDIVHVNLADAGPYFHLRTRAAHPSATIVTFQAALQQAAHGPNSVIGGIVATAARVVAVSRFGADNIAAFTAARREDIAVVAPGVPPEDFIPAERPPADPTIVFLGRLAPEKGCDIAIRALALLPPPARLLVIGDGPERERLGALADFLGVAGRVRFAGAVDDATRLTLMRTARALVAPSLHEELFGMIAVEGALMGLPVIASCTGGLQEIVAPGDTGFLVEKGDFAAMAAHLADLVNDPRRAHEMGQAGRRRALDLYTRDIMADAYEALYRDAVFVARVAVS